jgi:superfamily II helicase
MKDILNQLVTSTEPKINSSVTNDIISSCLEEVSKLVTHQYQTNKQATEPSSIPNIFRPYHNFISHNEQWIDDQSRKIWAEQIAKIVITQYCSMIEDVSDKNKVLLDIQLIGSEVTRHINKLLIITHLFEPS